MSFPGTAPCQSRGSTARVTTRLVWVDMLRGLALLGMVLYHGTWDLHAYGLVTVDPSVAVGWRIFGRCIAGVFLLLSGFSLSLAHRRGTTARTAVLRLARIAAGAALVSVTTRVLVPEAPVWFGILHCIVVTNILALALRPLPSSVVLGCALAAGMIPYGLSGHLSESWAWTGLAATEPRTLDFRPVLPWLALVLIGLVSGRTAAATWFATGRSAWRSARLLAWAGRHSLGLYLVHQPVLVGLLMLIYGAMPSPAADVAALRDPAEGSAFLQQCQAHCFAAGGEQALCRSTCHCVLTAIAAKRPVRTLQAAVALCRSASSGVQP